jgi:hypothetical protein
MGDQIAKLKVKNEFNPVLNGIANEMRDIKVLLAQIDGRLQTLAETFLANIGQMFEAIIKEEGPVT